MIADKNIKDYSITKHIPMFVFQSYPKIQRLTLDGNKLGDDGAIAVAWLLREQESFLESVVRFRDC